MTAPVRLAPHRNFPDQRAQEESPRRKRAAEGDEQNMKRQTDVPRHDTPADTRTIGDLHPSTDHAAPQTPGTEYDGSVTVQLSNLHKRPERATPVEAAAALIQLSLHESNGPVEDLSGALGRLAQLVQTKPDTQTRAAEIHHQLARDVAVCIESLQFHDRLAQQLTQVRNILATLAYSAPADMPPEHHTESDPHKWMVMVENLRARFTSESHLILFNLLLPEGATRPAVPALHANEGSVELF